MVPAFKELMREKSEKTTHLHSVIRAMEAPGTRETSGRGHASGVREGFRGIGNVKNESSRVAEALGLKERRVAVRLGKKPGEQVVKGPEHLLSTCCERLQRPTLRRLDFIL